MKKFDPAKLFVRGKQRRLPPLASDLDAVASGKRHILERGFFVESICGADPEFVAVLREGFARDLVVVFSNHGPQIPGADILMQQPRMYVLRAEELWRIAADRALHATAYTDGRTSNAARMQERALRGDPKSHRKKLLAEIRYERSSWGSCDVYAVLTKPQLTAIKELGNRCFGERELVEQLTFFIPRGNLCANAFELVPKGLTLARAGIGWRTIRSIFGDPYKWPRRGRRAQLTRPQIAKLSSGYVSNVQLLGARGWTS